MDTGIKADEMSLERAFTLLREGMDPKKAYLTKKLARDILKISVPAARRYLKIAENVGLLVAKRDGRYKAYALPDEIPEEEIARIESEERKKMKVK